MSREEVGAAAPREVTGAMSGEDVTEPYKYIHGAQT